MKCLVIVLVMFLITTLSSIASAKDVLELQATNFELALSSYSYIAILFYDDKPTSVSMLNTWRKVASSISSLYKDGEIATINTNDEDAKELIDAYALPVPSIRVFRHGIMGDYRGPYDVDGMSSYLLIDSQPSVKFIASQEEMQNVLRSVMNTIVLGFFTGTINDDSMEGGSVSDEWTQFQLSADNLRDHASFFAIQSSAFAAKLGIDTTKASVHILQETPAEGFSLLSHRGELLEGALSEWVLKNAVAAMGEISFSSSTGELFATQFFSAQKLKFILFLSPEDLASASAGSSVLESWKKVSEVFRKSALFAYMVGNAVPDVLDYFAVDAEADVPLIVAHEPLKDAKYKSSRMTSLDMTVMQEFVAGVVSGYIKKVARSEPLPRGKVQSKKSNVVKAVGVNVVDVVSAPQVDVLLEVYAPWCAHCKKLRPTLDVLSKAVQGEKRIVVAHIDGTANDLPASWKIKGYPTLLFFPARDKPYAEGSPVPRPYWDAGHSLHDLMGFLLKQSSFDAKTLKVATSEQLGTLLGDEEQLRLEYEAADRWLERNEGRQRLDSPLMDWAAGEVIFDGLRWHIAAAVTLAAYAIGLTLYLLVVGLRSSQNKANSVNSSSKSGKSKVKKSD